jgi:hypothetical protein
MRDTGHDITEIEILLTRFSREIDGKKYVALSDNVRLVQDRGKQLLSIRDVIAACYDFVEQRR